MKKVLINTVFIFFLISLSGPVLADRSRSDFLYENYYCSYEKGGIEIESYIGMDNDVIIPDSINNYPVIKIGEEAFKSNMNLSSITFPISLKEIDEEAFKGCSNLKIINFNQNLREVDDEVFAYCNSLESITIPGSIKEVSEKCFYADSNLNKVIINNGVKSIDKDAFRNCFNLKEVEIPSSVTKINRNSFDQNSGLIIIAPVGSYAERFAQDNGFTNNSEPSSKPEQPSNIPLRDIDIVNDDLIMSVGEVKNLIIRYIPENATNKALVYSSSNESIVKVSQDGVVEAVGSGKTKIIVRSLDGKITEDCEVLVRSNNNSTVIREIKLNRDDVVLEPGMTFQLKATTFPSNMESELNWYSKNPAIATVDNNGLVTAISKGKTEIIVVSSDGREDEDCDIHVRENGLSSESIPVKKVLLDREDLYLTQGEEIQLKATILPKNASNQEVIWLSTNSNVASVDQSGKIRALGQGKAEIKVISLDGHHDADCDVIVLNKDLQKPDSTQNIPVRDIDINDDLYLSVGSTFNLNVFIIPVNATNQTVTFKSLNENIVKVNNVGIIEAIGIGKTKVIATTEDGNHTDDCEITVGNENRDPGDPEIIPVRDIDIDDYLNLKSNESGYISFRISPVNATNQNIVWNSLNPDIATVDQSGLVKAVNVGRTEIIATTEDGNFTDDCDVIVSPTSTEPNKLEAIQLSTTQASIIKGENLSIKASPVPLEAINSEMTWTSLDNNIATVDNTGNIKALTEGSTSIKVSSNNGEINAECSITVINDDLNESIPNIKYSVHVQDYGWKDYVQNGTIAGTTGESKRLEGIKINLENQPDNIRYKTHIQDIGWQDWKSNNDLSGTTGESKRLEAIQIELTGGLETKYDIYYRVHCENFGWLNWAKNGASAGSSGFSQRLEAIQIQLVVKDQPAPICSPSNDSSLSYVSK